MTDDRPTCVLRKLAESGAVLTPSEYYALPVLARQRLVDMRVEDRVERRAFRQLVHWLKRTFLDIGTEAPPTEEPWVPWRASDPPAELEVSQHEWDALDVDERFRLVQRITLQAQTA